MQMELKVKRIVRVFLFLPFCGDGDAVRMPGYAEVMIATKPKTTMHRAIQIMYMT